MKPPKIKYKNTNKQLNAMKDKRWVQRANEDKKESINNKTHYMSQLTLDDGRELVYPSVREVDGKLKELDNKSAFELARDNQDALVYNSRKKADKASIYGYKKHSNFPKEVVKEAKKDWKKHKRTMRYGKTKRYRNGMNIAGDVSSAMGGLTDLIGINSTNDKTKNAAKHIGVGLKAFGDQARNFKPKEQETAIAPPAPNADQFDPNKTGTFKGSVPLYETDPNYGARDQVLGMDYQTPTINTTSNLNPMPYRNGVNKRDKKRYV